jgi:hypothetical protein
LSQPDCLATTGICGIFRLEWAALRSTNAVKLYAAEKLYEAFKTARVSDRLSSTLVGQSLRAGVEAEPLRRIVRPIWTARSARAKGS